MKNIGKRIYDLIIKLISVKTIPAIIFSIGYLKESTTANAIACLTAWALVVGFRYAEKVSSLMKAKV
jgi:hypothetical protein